MKNYIYCILTVLTSCSALCADQTVSGPEQLALAFFGPDGLNLGPDAVKKTTTVLTLLSNATDYQREQALRIVLEKLRTHEQTLEQQAAADRAQNIPVARELYHKLFVAQERIKHLENIQKQLAEMPYITMLYEKVTDYITSWWSDEPRADELAQAILAFMDIEGEYILHDYNNVVRYIVLLAQHPLPPILAPWHDKQVQYVLQARAMRLSTTQVQMSIASKGISLLESEAVKGMYVQGVAMFAGTIAIEMSDAQSAKELTALGKDMETMQTELTHSFSLLQEAQAKNFSALITTFTEKRQQLADESGQEGNLFQKELEYMNRSVAKFALGTQLLNEDLIALDIMFQASPMLTPKAITWYNPFYQSVYWQNEDKTVTQLGDWQYDHHDNHFWQQSIVQFAPQQKSPEPSFNSIFTEYIPPSTNPYDIEVDCTLVQTAYPFFAGVMFNKSRWISGNPECLSQYRLIGFYGTQEKADDPKTRAINLCFAQQKLIIPSDTSKKSQIIGPLEQIMSEKTTVVCALSEQAATKDDVQNLIRNPQTYTIQIRTNVNAITWRLLKKNGKDAVLVKEGTITNLEYQLNPDAPQDAQAVFKQKQYTLFNYHGIGFMAPGCQAAFGLSKPEALVYTQQQRDDFAREQNLAEGK